MAKVNPLLSVVVPVYNEGAVLHAFHLSLLHVLEPLTEGSFEVIYCNDGSQDDTAAHIQAWHAKDARIKALSLSRNFGKEIALSAGIARAQGQAVLTIDGDGQHPVELIPHFLESWRAGNKVVIGLRTENSKEGWFKRLGSRYFHLLFNKLTGQQLVAGSSDFRLIDHEVQQEFVRMSESDRVVRGLIDWLGFKRDYIHFKAYAREHGTAGYSKRKLLKLAADSFVSLSPTPLYLFGYLGIMITVLALLLGIAIIIEQLLLGDPLHWHFTGTAMLGILILFLVGIVLLSQGILSLYISHIHNQSKQRPLYVIDYEASAGLTKNFED